jgi:hypothetical protein
MSNRRRSTGTALLAPFAASHVMLTCRLAIIYVASVCIIAGCSSTPKGPICYPVRGKVTSKGRPLPEAMIVLHRIGGDVEGNQKPLAYSGISGNFSFTTFKQNDGAPPGEYAITVELQGLQTGGEEPVRSGPNILPPKYAKPGTSGLKCTIVEGENQIPPIEIK